MATFSFKEYFSHIKAETLFQNVHHPRFLFTSPVADPLTFAQSRSAWCFLTFGFYLFMFAQRVKVPYFVLNVPYVVMLLERKDVDTFLSTHVFISNFAMHHDARPSVLARLLNSMPICCRVMRKQTGAAFHMSGPSIT